MNEINITMSWDDGSPYDMRLAELLLKYNISSTFYIPKNNSEGIPVLKETDIKLLSTQFEIGGHTIDHLRLNSLSNKDKLFQINESKNWLEDLTGDDIKGFCFPGGEFDQSILSIVKDSGYYYSRTTENFRNDITDLYKMPTTLQLFNHDSYILFFNMLKAKNSIKKIYSYYPILVSNEFFNRFEYILHYAEKMNFQYLHFWGHSWEINEYNLWSPLEDIFKLINERADSVSSMTNYQCAKFYSEKSK